MTESICIMPMLVLVYLKLMFMERDLEKRLAAIEKKIDGHKADGATSS